MDGVVVGIKHLVKTKHRVSKAKQRKLGGGGKEGRARKRER